MLPGDPNLPPGTFERHFSSGREPCPYCDGTGELNLSDCCGVRLAGQTPEGIDWADAMRCPACGDDCERTRCEECRGEGCGMSEAERREEYEERKEEMRREERRLDL